MNKESLPSRQGCGEPGQKNKLRCRFCREEDDVAESHFI